MKRWLVEGTADMVDTADMVGTAATLGTVAMAVIGGAGAGAGLASASLLDLAMATVVDAGPTIMAATSLVTGCTTS